MRAALAAAGPSAALARPAHAHRPVRASAMPPKDTASQPSTRAAAAPPSKSGYPELETSAADTGLLPRREPGSFPSPAIVAAWNRLSVELLEGADTGAPPAAAGEEATFDPLRDGPARYLGYSNECGEAFAAWLPPFGVPLSYAVAIGYVLVDTVDKGLKAYARAKQELEGGAVPVRADVDTGRLALLLAAERSVDTIVWQLLASVFVPGYTIHTVVAAVHAGLGPLEALPAVQGAAGGLAALVGAPSGAALLAVADKSLPTVAGLAAIPFIVHPIDNAIHALLNVTLRPALKKAVCEGGQGKEAGLALCEECGPWKKGEAKKGMH